jgi:hypothetical protein
MASDNTSSKSVYLDREENVTKGANSAKRVVPYAYSAADDTMSPIPLPFLTKKFDRLIITYTDSTKGTVASIVSKLSGVTQETITNSYTATVDDLVRT